MKNVWGAYFVWLIITSVMAVANWAETKNIVQQCAVPLVALACAIIPGLACWALEKIKP